MSTEQQSAPESTTSTSEGVQDVNMAPEAPTNFYLIEGTDGGPLKISESAVQQSKTLSDLILNLGYSPDASMEPIPVGNVSGATLQKVVEWCEHHAGEPLPTAQESNAKTVVVPDWDSKFLELSEVDMYHVICASNYLDIKRLMVYACKMVSMKSKGLDADGLRKVYNVPTDAEDEKERKEREKQMVEPMETEEKTP